MYLYRVRVLADIAGFDRDPNAPQMDTDEPGEAYTSFRVLGGLNAVTGTRTGSPGVPWPPGI